MDSFEEYSDTMDRIMNRIKVISEKHRDRHNQYRHTMQVIASLYGFNNETIDIINHEMGLVINCYEEMIDVLKELGGTQTEYALHIQSEAVEMRNKFNEYLEKDSNGLQWKHLSSVDLTKDS